MDNTTFTGRTYDNSGSVFLDNVFIFNNIIKDDGNVNMHLNYWQYSDNKANNPSITANNYLVFNHHFFFKDKIDSQCFFQIITEELLIKQTILILWGILNHNPVYRMKNLQLFQMCMLMQIMNCLKKGGKVTCSIFKKMPLKEIQAKVEQSKQKYFEIKPIIP